MAKINRVPTAEDFADETVDVPSSEEIVNEELNPLRKLNRTPSAVGSGWGAPVTERRETVKSDQLVLKGKGKRIVKILDEIPAVKYGRHFLKSAGPNGRFYTCLQDDLRQGDCPLCEKGVNRVQTFIMNVVDMGDDPSKVLTWTFGNEVSTTLQSLAENPQGDYWALNDESRYFQVYHEKIAAREAPATRVQRLKARDLMDDYGLVALTESEITELATQRYGDEVVFINDFAYLAGVKVQESDLPQKKRS